MAFYFLLVKAKSLARAIYEFQRDIGNKKASYINFTLEELVDCVDAIELINLSFLDVSKRKIRIATFASSHFYNSFWLTNADKFAKVVAYFEKIIANSQILDSELQQSITSAVTSAVITPVAAIQAKHKNEMFFLQEMIKKSLLLKKSPFATSLSISTSTRQIKKVK